ncbi:hypothetical protein KCP75_14090 [Salmonella enterica subsp. enterica]|nr:hypothetical protein KCP75_14090 [Salmonella enterica subsp. enterica]
MSGIVHIAGNHAKNGQHMFGTPYKFLNRRWILISQLDDWQTREELSTDIHVSSARCTRRTVEFIAHKSPAFTDVD